MLGWDRSRDSLETVISPFINFYGLPPRASSHFLPGVSATVASRFSMACDLITEMALITVVSAADRRGRAGGMRRGACRLQDWRVLSQCYTPGGLHIKRTVCLMIMSYSAAHVIVRATGWERYSIRGTIETENVEDPSTDEVSRTALNKSRDPRKSDRSCISIRTHLALVMFLTYTKMLERRTKWSPHEKWKKICFTTAMNTGSRRIIKRVFKFLNAAIRDIFITLVAYTGVSILDVRNHRFPLLHLV